MDYCKRILTDEEYELLKDKEHRDIDQWLESQLPRYILIGYGYYGCDDITDEDGKHIIRYRTGSSCD